MTDRIPSDHDAVESHRLHLDTVGRTSRVQVPLPGALSCEPDDLVSLSLAGTEAFAVVEATLNGTPAIRGAYPDRRLARSRDGTDRLGAWVAETDLSPGDPLLLDILTAGYAYGLRVPGDRVVYEPPDEPDSSLQSIARDLE